MLKLERPRFGVDVPTKKALMAFVHGIYVREVKRPAEPINNQEQ